MIQSSAQILCSPSSWFLMSDIMAGIDCTPYTVEARPDQTLRQVFHTASVPEAFRLRLAGVGVLTNDVLANLGESPQVFVQNIKALLGGDNPFGKAPQFIIVEAKLVSSWRKSRALMESTDSKRSKLMEDRHKIPEIPIHEYYSYRANLVTRHPDVLVVDYKEPHKKFLERLIRDLTVNEVIHQSTHPSVNSSISQRIHESTHPSVNSSVNQFVRQSNHQSIHPCVNSSICQLIQQSIRPSINSSINQFINQSTRLSVDSSISQFIHKSTDP